MKGIGKINLKKYFYFLLFGVILIELYLILNTSKKIDENKIILKTKMNNMILKKNNVSKIILDNERLEKEINMLKNEQIYTLRNYQNQKNDLIKIKESISGEFHKKYEDYELKEKLYKYKFIEDNETLNE